MSDYFLGEIRLFSFAFAPQGWHFADGSVMQIQQNNALYSLLGIHFGGDGQKTFNLPDLRGRTPVHVNLPVGAATIQTGKQGTVGGVDSYALAATEAADHLHPVVGTSDAGTKGRFGATGAPSMPATAQKTAGNPGNPASIYVAPSASADYVALAPGMTVPLGVAVAHENRQPYLAANYCISTVGLYPTRP
jgi:microcystin-dependent protein